MERRIVALMLAWIMTLAFAPSVVADAPADLLRIQLNDAVNDFKVLANQILISEENGQRVVAISGKVNIGQGKSLIRCDQAIIWIDIGELKRDTKTRGINSTEGPVPVVIDEKTRSGDAVVLAYATSGDIILPPHGRVQAGSLRNSRSTTREPGKAAAKTARGSSDPQNALRMSQSPRAKVNKALRILRWTSALLPSRLAR